jgi:hypothetical protein
LAKIIMATSIIPARWFACTIDAVYVDPTEKIPLFLEKPPPHHEPFEGGSFAFKPSRYAYAKSYKAYYVGDEQASVSNQPALRRTESFKTLLKILDTDYEFRKELFEGLSAADISHMAVAFGLKLSQSEKRKHLNPAKVICEHFTGAKECIKLGWGVTILGQDTAKAINSLINPAGGSKRCIRPDILADPNPPAQVTKCLLVFTAPQRGTDPKIWKQTGGTPEELEEFTGLGRGLAQPTFSEWAYTAFKMIATVHGFYYVHKQSSGIRTGGQLRGLIGCSSTFPRRLDMMADRDPLRLRGAETRSRLSTVRNMNLHGTPAEMKTKTLGLRDGRCLLQKMIN